MKISTTNLKKLIKEELFYRAFYRGETINEVGPPPDMDAPGWHPNDTQEWEREARAEERGERDREKNAFLANEQARWEDEFAVDDDTDAKLITDILGRTYDEVYDVLFGDY